MKYKLFYSAFIVLWIFSDDCFSQDYDSLFNKAKFYYENEEYQIAIPYFSKCVDNNPGESRAYKLRGNCYLEIGQYNNAIQDYQDALKLNKESDLFYNLGNAYDRKENADSAIYYFHRFIEMEPKLTDGYIRLCILFMYNHPELGDSAVYYAGRAVNIEPGSTVNLNFLAMAYYSSHQYKSALETALIGIGIDSSFSLLNQTAGISSFFLKDYPSAIFYFERAYKYNPNDYTLLDYKIQSLLLLNTKPEQIQYQSGSRISFIEISPENIKKTEEKVLAKTGNYSYKKLIHKYQSSPLTMSLDEFYMLYIGFALQPGYAPYNKPIVSKIKENDLISEADDLEEILLKNPTDFPSYLNLADIYLEMGNKEKYFENRFKYFGFAESIKASGDGLSPKTAFIVNDVTHEYSIMLSLGYRVKSQSMIKQKNHKYDVLTGTDTKNKDVVIYFNIDRPLRTLPKNGKN